MERVADSDSTRRRHLVFHTVSSICLGVFCGLMAAEGLKSIAQALSLEKQKICDCKLYRPVMATIGGGALGLWEVYQGLRQREGSQNQGNPSKSIPR